MKKNILYLHGYNGSLTPAKQTVLERFGYVMAPSIVYDNPDYFNKLVVPAATADIIIGSSFGGHTAHLLSLLYNKPALLFNPAFVTSIPNPDLSGFAFPHFKSSRTHIILGKKDDVIFYKDNLEYINRTITQKDMSLISLEHLGHRIPEDVFAEQVATFMEEVAAEPKTSTH
ncbi:YqiA/YcfP family alpha/beta fold hydrolase [Rufibacter roseus]|uniref:YqiA/YcfP family alpha/beta fold hydrolase n=1 Tax=Rufibacter roseus TaxID=1567108 RepID=A0ABW2DJ88_9BACT|nr:YqiA/YcfP family alpha/beta fold hydrolase [Rufibacter roseus]